MPPQDATPERPRSENHLPRRAFIRLLGGVGGGLALAASGCRRALETPAAVSTSTNIPARTIPPPSATLVPASSQVAPQSTPTPGLSRLLDIEADLYATALGFDPVEVIRRAALVPLLGTPPTRIVTVQDPLTSTPLLISLQQASWQRATLRRLAAPMQMRIGNLLDEAQWPFLSEEFNFGLITSGWGWSTQPASRTTYSFKWEDSQISAGRKRGVTHFRLMHVLAPHDGELPAWLQKGGFGPDELTSILRKYVADVMRHFADSVEEYVVVNEPFFSGNVFNDALGQDYIDIAFETARKVNPDATLMLNCWGNHSLAGPYTTAFKRIVDRLKTKGLIDKIGLQMHIWPYEASPHTITETIRAYGIPAAVTEFDIDMRDIAGAPAERYALQARTYESVLGAAIDAGVTELSFWGCNDSLSWLENPEFYSAPDADPNMWDGQSRPKPAYYATRRVLLKALSEWCGAQ